MCHAKRRLKVTKLAEIIYLLATFDSYAHSVCSFFSQKEMLNFLPALWQAANTEPAATFPISEWIAAATVPAPTPTVPNPAAPVKFVKEKKLFLVGLENLEYIRLLRSSFCYIIYTQLFAAWWFFLRTKKCRQSHSCNCSSNCRSRQNSSYYTHCLLWYHFCGWNNQEWLIVYYCVFGIFYLLIFAFPLLKINECLVRLIWIANPKSLYLRLVETL